VFLFPRPQMRPPLPPVVGGAGSGPVAAAAPAPVVASAAGYRRRRRRRRERGEGKEVGGGGDEGVGYRWRRRAGSDAYCARLRECTLRRAARTGKRAAVAPGRCWRRRPGPAAVQAFAVWPAVAPGRCRPPSPRAGSGAVAPGRQRCRHGPPRRRRRAGPGIK
jgi:hypothetical protein